MEGAARAWVDPPASSPEERAQEEVLLVLAGDRGSKGRVGRVADLKHGNGAAGLDPREDGGVQEINVVRRSSRHALHKQEIRAQLQAGLCRGIGEKPGGEACVSNTGWQVTPSSSIHNSEIPRKRSRRNGFLYENHRLVVTRNAIIHEGRARAEDVANGIRGVAQGAGTITYGPARQLVGHVAGVGPAGRPEDAESAKENCAEHG